MSGPLSFEVPTRLQYFASLVAEDETLALLEAAISVAEDETPDLDTQAVLAEIDQLASALGRRLAVDAAPMQRLRLLNRYFFHELGFTGNVNDFYDPRNSYLPDVLARRRGIPITLALVYMELASQIGLAVRGVSFPGHFLVKVHVPQGEIVIDPFSGVSLSRDDLDARLQPYRVQRGLLGDNEVPLGLFLQAAPARDILARLLRNLKEIHRTAGDAARLLAVQQRLLILLPEAFEERRDRGLAYARLGRIDLAATDVAAYLERHAAAPDADALRRQLESWRGRGGGRTH